ncbi:MAG: 16S rRNA (guanine(966)-N(2))-methyltransferase RsmD [Candidatus Omnitrophica bacterium]|nr:16S rRNA (guanine(966)-N(2))-methyltransferase RsmD [Candidatus Omnitrophota bacterium]
MRVTGGRFLGRQLLSPKGPAVRTTLDHVRQAIFNLLGERVEGARVLDLFSGSGALGIEALSRGASHVTFLDRSLFCIRTLQANLRNLEEDDRCAVLRSDALTGIRNLAKRGALFDLVLLDPPYGGPLAIKSLNALADCAILLPSGLVVTEHDKRHPLPPKVESKAGRLILQRRERYGDTALTIYFCQRCQAL